MIRKLKSLGKALIVSAGIVIGVGSVAHADLFLTLSDGVTQVNGSLIGGVTSGAGFVGGPGTGTVPSQLTFTGNVGVFTVNLSIDARSSQSALLGNLRIDVETVTTSNAASTLSIYAVQTGYTLPTGAVAVLSEAASAIWSSENGATQTGKAWIDVQNGNLGGNFIPGVPPGADAATGTCTGTETTGGLSVAVPCNVAPVNVAGFATPYSMSQLMTIKLANTTGQLNNAIGNSNVQANVVTTPEPSSLFLIGSGLLAFAAWGRKRREDN